MFANHHDVRDYVRRFGPETPYLQAAAGTLANLVDWADWNSDGWVYWQPPSKAARRLQELLWAAWVPARFAEAVDISAADLAAAYKPLRAFRTRCNNNPRRPDADFTIEEPRVL